MTQSTTVVIASYGRPAYLWACLDALYRKTQSPARFILVDNWHPDPGVGTVIDGFARRGMLAEVHRFPTNSPDNLREAYAASLAAAGDEHVFLESDAVVSCVAGCWLAEMLRIFRSSPGIGMLGSLIDSEDFQPERVSLSLNSANGQTRFLAKLDSPERGFKAGDAWHSTERDFFPTEPPCPISNPPGRLLMLRTDAMRECGLIPDGALATRFREAGFQPAVTARVRHRHLSLLNIFDYHDYDALNRDRFFNSLESSPQGNGGNSP
jgi:GT2 family glycosyltransferase